MTTAALQSFLDSAPEMVQQVVFLGGGAHPVWEDHAAVFAQAIETVCTPADGAPTAFVGVHALNRLTRSRTPMGVILTDRAMCVRSTLTASGGAAPRVLGYREGASAQDLAAEVVGLLEAGQVLEGEVLQAVGQALAGLLPLVLPTVVRSQTGPGAGASVLSDPDELRRQLGLQEVLLTADEAAKSLRQVSAVMPVEGARWACLARLVLGLGKPYGMVVTKAGVISRDSMEEPVSSTWEQVRATPAAPLEDDRFTVGPDVHYLPVRMARHRDAVVEFVNGVSRMAL